MCFVIIAHKWDDISIEQSQWYDLSNFAQEWGFMARASSIALLFGLDWNLDFDISSVGCVHGTNQWQVVVFSRRQHFFCRYNFDNSGKECVAPKEK
jgi:hypothetical protein